jgi:hypothetical protein
MRDVACCTDVRLAAAPLLADTLVGQVKALKS